MSEKEKSSMFHCTTTIKKDSDSCDAVMVIIGTLGALLYQLSIAEMQQS